jgi:hypothetical protein
MYCPDLSPYRSRPDEDQPDLHLLSVGWLDGQYPYPRGQVPTSFVERLWSFCEYKVNALFVLYHCTFCRDTTWYYPARCGRNKVHLGSSEIRVLGRGATVYVAPDLIYHYVTAHLYRPPQAFIEAVMDGPLPDTPAYRQRASWQVLCVSRPSPPATGR